MVRSLVTFAVFMLSISCAHQMPPVENGVTPLSERDYAEILRKTTVKTNQYAGLYQTFQADMTMETSEMQTAALRQRAYFLQWDQKQFQMEREKVLQDNSAYSKFFLRFFSPEHDYDDLHKGKTIWRVYLELNGQRFEGKVRKLTEKYVELQTIYPHLDRFSTPYEISFNVPMVTVEKADAKVTLTSSLGSAQYTFPMQK